MSTTAQTAIATAFDVFDDSREFFAPVDSDVLDMLLGQYASTKTHTEAAAALINPGGRLVSILPASMAGKDFLPGFTCEWSPVYPGEFDGTGTAVVILLAKKMV